ncbi:MAG: sulfite exporter TauE/SafE family protein [Granulosicoccus sp.]
MELIIYTAGVIFVAYFIRGLAGFGSGLVAIPLLLLAHPLEIVVPLVVALDFLGSLAQGVKNRENISWAEITPLLPFTLIGCGTALLLFKSIDTGVLTTALAVFIVVFSIYQLLPLPDLKGSRYWCVPAGLMGGLVGTLFGTGGPFYMIYLTIRGLDKVQTRSSFAAYFFVDGTIRLVGFTVFGLLNTPVAIFLLKYLPVAALALFVGGKAHVTISNQTFKYFISLILVFSGYKLLTN